MKCDFQNARKLLKDDFLHIRIQTSLQSYPLTNYDAPLSNLPVLLSISQETQIDLQHEPMNTCAEIDFRFGKFRSFWFQQYIGAPILVKNCSSYAHLKIRPLLTASIAHVAYILTLQKLKLQNKSNIILKFYALHIELRRNKIKF